ncbi:hypothetical protein D3C78_1378360 [compost metagenome]
MLEWVTGHAISRPTQVVVTRLQPLHRNFEEVSGSVHQHAVVLVNGKVLEQLTGIAKAEAVAVLDVLCQALVIHLRIPRSQHSQVPLRIAEGLL